MTVNVSILDTNLGVFSFSNHQVLEGAGFTALVPLQPGTNRLVAQYGPHATTRRVLHTPTLCEKYVRLIYVTCLNEEQFQVRF